MTALVITGYGVVSAAGVGATAMIDALSAGAPLLPDVTGMYAERLPYPAAPALTDFDVRALLGRKGTGFIDRATALALVACGQAIASSGLVIDDSSRERIGVALGTTVGSLRSSSEYSRETLVAERPYLVNPMLFPNTVMNCAAGQAAIRYGLKGVNSTVAGGRLGFLSALSYAVNVLRRGYAGAMLVGAVEEFTPHVAWTHHRLGRAGLPGEAAAVFVLERRDAMLARGRRPVAELGAVAVGYSPGGRAGELADRVASTLLGAMRRTGVEPGRLGAVAASEPSEAADEEIEAAAMAAAGVAGQAGRVRVRSVLGDCGAAAAALQFAALLESSSGSSLLVGWSAEGALGASVVRNLGAAALRE